MYIFEPVLLALIFAFLHWSHKHWPILRIPKPLVGGTLALLVLTGLFLRHQEVSLTYDSQRIVSDLKKYREQRLDSDSPRLLPNTTVAGDGGFSDLAIVLENSRPLRGYAVLMSAPVENQEWHEREALNAILTGETRADFEKQQTLAAAGFGWGPWIRRPDGNETFLRERLKAYDEVSKNLGASLDRFKVRYVAQRLDSKPPHDLAANISENWHQIQSGPHWSLWERSPQ
jgi:hypothetical protein